MSPSGAHRGSELVMMTMNLPDRRAMQRRPGTCKHCVLSRQPQIHFPLLVGVRQLVSAIWPHPSRVSRWPFHSCTHLCVLLCLASCCPSLSDSPSFTCIFWTLCIIFRQCTCNLLRPTTQMSLIGGMSAILLYSSSHSVASCWL